MNLQQDKLVFLVHSIFTKLFAGKFDSLLFVVKLSACCNNETQTITARRFSNRLY